MMTMDQLRTIKQDTPKACLRNGVHIMVTEWLGSDTGYDGIEAS
jgi:hypothetical protein